MKFTGFLVSVMLLMVEQAMPSPYVRPTVFGNVSNTMTVAREEGS